MKLFARRMGKGPSPRAEINVTPLVDVVLVLLIIFMVVTPFLRPIDVTLPTAENAEPSGELPLVLTLRADGAIFLSDREVSMEALAAEVRAEDVLVRADGSLRFETVRRVMEQLASAGVTDIDLATVRAETEER